MEAAEVITAIGGLPWWAVLVILILFVFFAVVVLAAVIYNGFNLKFVKFDGLKKIAEANKKEQIERNVMQKEFPRTVDLKRYAEDIDRETKGDIIDALHGLILELTESNSRRGCSFIGDSVKNELRILMKNYVNKNHIVTKCYPENITEEKKKLLAEIKERYQIMLLKMQTIKCDGNADALPPWRSVQPSVKSFLDDFFDAMKKNIIKGCERKIIMYENKKDLFSADWIVESYIDDPINKNKEYIKKLS